MIRKYLVLGFLFLLALTAACREVAVADGDKALFVTVRELAPYGYTFERPEKYETFKKTYFYDDTYQIEYEFEAPEEQKSKSLYLSESISIGNDESDARFIKSSEEWVISFGLKAGGLQTEEKKGFYSYGDNSAFYVLKEDGRPVGNYFTTRIGKKSFSFLIAGKYIDDVTFWREVVEPRLETFKSYTP
jgi:hypothetical protein